MKHSDILYTVYICCPAQSLDMMCEEYFNIYIKVFILNIFSRNVRRRISQETNIKCMNVVLMRSRCIQAQCTLNITPSTNHSRLLQSYAKRESVQDLYTNVKYLSDVLPIYNAILQHFYDAPNYRTIPIGVR